MKEQIRLDAFGPADFDHLIRWIQSKEDLVQFAGPIFQFPLTREQLENYLEHKDKIPLKVVLIETGESIGHCEINMGNSLPRLSRILIGPVHLRGKGLGQEIVNHLLDRIFDTSDHQVVDLNVFSWNIPAIRCYEKVGFRIIPENTDTLKVMGLSWTRFNMQIHKDNWSSMRHTPSE